MASWFGQLKKVDVNEKAAYSNELQTNAKDFANLVLGKATKVGCAVNTCLREGFQVAICSVRRVYLFQSRPVPRDTTPVVDDLLYTVGKTCSGCTAASKTCHKGLPGICV
ncbi:hypothetical protein Aduo_000168 [Ancylostoma duodenale]